MGRGPSADKDGLKKGPWTAEEDQKLIEYIRNHGHGRWSTVPKGAGLNRCGKSCRLRWTNYLRPDIKRGKFTFEEEETIIQLHSILGNKWSAIAARLPGRTDNEIKNYWNTHLRKRLLKMGIDPVTHKPRLDLLELYSILNSSLTSSSAQGNFQNLSGSIQTLFNSNLLHLITSLALSKSNKCFQYLPRNLQALNQYSNNNLHFQNQFQPCLNPLVNQAPSTGLSQNSLPYMYQHELQEESMLSKVIIPVQRESGVAQNLVPGQDVDSGNNQFDYAFVKLLSDDDEMLQKGNNCENNLKYGFNSVKSTSTSSSAPINSSTTFVNGSSFAEDEKNSYCNNIISQVSHPLDLDDFLCNQI